MYVFGFRKIKIREFERGFMFRDKVFVRVLMPGELWIFDPFAKVRVDVMSVRDPWIRHADLDVIVRAGALKEQALVLDLKDTQRALVWVDGRFEAVLGRGLHALWTVFREVKAEIVDAREPRFTRDDLLVIARGAGTNENLDVYTVENGFTGLYFRDGVFQAALGAGAHAFWKGVAKIKVISVDLREQVCDIAGQEIMTADKVTLRLNAVATYRVTDALKAVTTVDDYRQALYREAQLVLRAVIGTRELDALLAEKDAVARELENLLRTRTAVLGLEVVLLGIRDVIMPGDMKDLMNKVTEAKKAAEATLITRREETAAMRMQANTAKILENNPTLMKLRELEVLEKVAAKSNLKVVLGEKGLADRVMKLL
ncbi:MAG TPA: slipin family protein [Planctomycetota bacterium]|nr:slipin family protein [Planctomycetota bacterium]